MTYAPYAAECRAAYLSVKLGKLIMKLDNAKGTFVRFEKEKKELETAIRDNVEKIRSYEEWIKETKEEIESLKAGRGGYL